jgi:hypothetical protein
LRRSHLHFFYYQWLPSFPCHSSYRLSKMHPVIARHKWEIQIHKMTTAQRIKNTSQIPQGIMNFLGYLCNIWLDQQCSTSLF